MSQHNPAKCMRPTTAIPPELRSLSHRETARRLAEVERDRLAEIDRYWALCRSDPERAAQLAAAMTPVACDLLLLACHVGSPPKPSAIQYLSIVTARLLQVAAVREAFDEGMDDHITADPADLFWQDGQLVAHTTVDGNPVSVLRYMGPLFNPGSVPEEALTANEDGFLVCEQAVDGAGGEYEFLRAYVLGVESTDGHWTDVHIDLRSRSRLIRDLAALETLVDRGGLAGQDFDAPPLPTFPTSCDLLIAQLRAHKTALRLDGEMSSQQQAVVSARTDHLLQRAEDLRQKMKQLEDELYDIRCQIAETEACALEDETGFIRGDRVRHTLSHDEGTLEIARIGGNARFRLSGTESEITGEIRRGEWVTITPSASAGQGRR